MQRNLLLETIKAILSRRVAVWDGEVEMVGIYKRYTNRRPLIFLQARPVGSNITENPLRC